MMKGFEVFNIYAPIGGDFGVVKAAKVKGILSKILTGER
jgi:hypothetical protein